MKVVTIETLKIENFRAISRLELTLDPCTTVVRGKGGAGKSTIYDAWCWLLFGRDRQDSSLTEVRPLGRDGRVRSPLSLTQVTAELKVNGKKRSFRRTLRETPEGGLTSDFYVDGIPVRKTGFEAQVEELIPREKFRILTDPLAFGETFSIQEKRALLRGLMEDRQENDLPEPLKKAMGDLSLREFLDRLREQRLDLQRACNDLPFRISEMEGTLRQLGTPDYKGMEVRCLCLQEERKKLLAGTKIPMNRLQRINHQIEDLQQSLGRKETAESCGQRLLSLRADQEKVLKTLRENRRLTELGEEVLRKEWAAAEKRLNRLIGKVRLHLQPGNRESFLTYGGMGWQNLSRSERVRAGMELINLFSAGWGLYLPVFLDDLPGVPDTMSQKILLIRDEDARELQIL